MRDRDLVQKNTIAGNGIYADVRIIEQHILDVVFRERPRLWKYFTGVVVTLGCRAVHDHTTYVIAAAMRCAVSVFAKQVICIPG